MKLRSSPLVLLPALITALPVFATPLLHDSFSGPADSAPAGWSSVGENNASVVTTENLSIPGLADSVGGKLTLNGTTHQAYLRDFQGNPMSVGETVYYSFILQVDTFGTQFTQTGNTVIALTPSNVTGIGTSVAGIGIKKATETTFTLSVDGEFRGPGHGSSINLPTEYLLGTSIFIVASYTRGATNATSSSSFWINPDSADFGALSPPSVTMTDVTTARDIQSVIVITGTGSSSNPTSWSIDELRVGTTWADVTPIPEPASIALLGGLGTLSVAALRRRR